MRKLIAAVTLMLAFSINANAQDKKTAVKDVKNVKELTAEPLDPQTASKKDAGQLGDFLGLNDTEIMNFQRLFEMKQTVLQDKNMSEERKTEMRRVVEAKIRATLDGNQMQKLESNTELFKKLLN
jgi:hypothetical protein